MGDDLKERLLKYPTLTAQEAVNYIHKLEIKMTYTYVLLEISQQAYDEITARLRAAGYDHISGPNGEVDMRGLALIVEKKPK